MLKTLLNYTVLFVLISLLGCGPKVIPVAVEGAVINEERSSISIEKEGITVTAEATFLYRTPYDLEDYFTPFKVSIRNETGGEISVNYDNFILFDEKRTQYRAYSQEKMTEIIKSDPEYVMKPVDVNINIDLSEYTDPNSPPPYARGYDYSLYGSSYFDSSLGHWVYPPAYYSKGRRDDPGETLMQDIYLTALPVGNIMEGAQVSGHVYFKVDMRNIKSAKVHATVNGVVFELPFLVE